MRRWLLVLVACKSGSSKPPPDAAKPKPDAAVIDAVPIDAPAKQTPVPTKVAFGDHAACAVLSDGSVRCWGDNNVGQLGDGTKRISDAPVTPRVHGAKDIVIGRDNACALLDDGSVACWGMIGIGKPPPALEPTAASGVFKAQRVFAQYGAACAALADGAFVCWGDIDSHGRLRPVQVGEHRLPTPYAGMTRVVQLVDSGALVEGGDVVIWDNDGVPIHAGTTGVVEIASHHGVVCGRTEDGTTSCYGERAPCAPPPASPPPPPKKKPKGKAKDKTKDKAKPPPAKVVAVPIIKTKLPAAKQLAFDDGMCVVTTAGRLQCLDLADMCKLEPERPAPIRVEQAIGQCARIAGGTVSCWHRDQHDRRKAFAIEHVAHVTQLAAIRERGCALADGGVWCWDEQGRASQLSLP